MMRFKVFLLSVRRDQRATTFEFFPVRPPTSRQVNVKKRGAVQVNRALVGRGDLFVRIGGGGKEQEGWN